MQMPSPEDRAQLGAAGAAAGLGCSIVVSVILFIGGGIALDRVTDLSPLFTFIGIALALVAAGYQLYELTQVGRADRTPGPLTRQISRMPLRPAGRGGTSRAGPEPGQPGPAEHREEE